MNLRFLPLFEYFIFAASLYIIVVIIQALAHRREGAEIILAGSILLILTAVNDILLSNRIIESVFIASYGMFLFTFSQSFFLSRRSANLFASVESHAAELKAINTSLERFIPKEMLDFLEKKTITAVRLGDYIEAEMTVLFLDIRDFTARSESMTPAENFRFINLFLEHFGPLVRSHGGFIDKYLGDGFMALFPGDADDALCAALDMRDNLPIFNSRLQTAGAEPVRFGIGIHTGQLMLGTIGESMRMDTTVISDTVNTASRLEQLNKTLGTDILLSEETIEALRTPDGFRMVKLTEERLKGKSRLVQVYSLTAAGRQ